MKFRVVMSLAALTSAVAALRAAWSEEGHHEWDYGARHAPGHWGSPRSRRTEVGKTQSPIDIRNPVHAKLDPIRFDYHPTSLRIIDHGHTIQ
jgi:carbonic anhydrase